MANFEVRPTGSSTNDNQKEYRDNLSLSDSETEVARKSLAKVEAALGETDPVVPNNREPNELPEKVLDEVLVAQINKEVTRAVTEVTYLENLADARAMNKKLPGYSTMAEMVREDVTKDEANITNLDAARIKRQRETK